MYVKLDENNSNPTPYSIAQLRADNPDVSFPASFPESVLTDFKVYPYTYKAEPAYDSKTHYLVAGAFTKASNKWTRDWVITALDSDTAVNNIREYRNELLAKTDWTQLADAPVEDKAAYAVYRQALRDVPQQPGFPWSVNWPTNTAAPAISVG